MAVTEKNMRSPKLRARMRSIFASSVPAGPWSDLLIGLQRQRLAILLSWRDTILPLRRTYIGPAWITLQALAWVLLITLVFRRSLGEEHELYPLYVAAGVTIYQTITVLLHDGAGAFIREANLIRNVPNPYSIYVYRVFWKGVFNLLFQLPVLIGAVILTGASVGPMQALFWLLGAALCLFSFLGAAFALSALAAAVSDIVPLVQTAMRFLFFATPVFWYADEAGGVRRIFVDYNPLAYFVEVSRTALMGTPDAQLFAACFAFGVVFWAIGLSLFAFARPRLALWI